MVVRANKFRQHGRLRAPSEGGASASIDFAVPPSGITNTLSGDVKSITQSDIINASLDLFSICTGFDLSGISLEGSLFDAPSSVGDGDSAASRPGPANGGRNDRGKVAGGNGSGGTGYAQQDSQQQNFDRGQPYARYNQGLGRIYPALFDRDDSFEGFGDGYYGGGGTGGGDDAGGGGGGGGGE